MIEDDAVKRAVNPDGDSLTPGSIFLGVLFFAGTFVMCVMAATASEAFASSVFIFCPAVATIVGLLVASGGRPIGPGAAALFSIVATVATSGILLVFGLEAIPCILMAIGFVLPLTLGTAIFYGFVSIGLQRRYKPPTADVDPERSGNSMGAWIFIIVATPLPSATTWVESFFVGSDRSVSTSIVVDATPAEIWSNVVSFPQIDPNGQGSDHWTFALGYPQPVRCDLDGEGVGAYRYCIFEDDRVEDPVFDERITIWAPGQELSFTCDDQPSRLDPYLTVTDGQFLFVPLPDGRTKIIGTTWYTLRCAPYGYFDWWCEQILHGIHERVLEHAKRLSESAAPRDPGRPVTSRESASSREKP